MTVTEFPLARIAEDEDRASLVLLSGVVMVNGVPEIRQTAIRDRVLAECEAKRRIIEYRISEGYADDGMVMALRALASVYADHPDYREEWRV